MSEGGCNVCNPELRKAVAEGRDVTFEVDAEGEACLSCGARPRIRCMSYAIDKRGADICRDLGLYGRARALLAAPASTERDLLAPFAGAVTSFSLFGNYGQDHVVSDVQDLAQFDDASFDLFEACSVLDFVPDLTRALASVSRVLAPRSMILVHYSDWRMLNGDEPPRVARYRTNWSAPYYPKDYKQPVVKVGREWLAKEWRRHGFTIEQVVWRDPAYGKPLTWWFGWRTPET